MTIFKVMKIIGIITLSALSVCFSMVSSFLIFTAFKQNNLYYFLGGVFLFIWIVVICYNIILLVNAPYNMFEE